MSLCGSLVVYVYNYDLPVEYSTSYRADRRLYDIMLNVCWF